MSTVFDLSTLSLENGVHHIAVKAKADGHITSELSTNVEYVVGGYRVTITASGDWHHTSESNISIYDGQDATGTLLFHEAPSAIDHFPQTFVISSGYLYILLDAPWLMGGVESSDFTMTSDYFIIDKNGSVDIAVWDWDD